MKRAVLQRVRTASIVKVMLDILRRRHAAPGLSWELELDCGHFVQRPLVATKGGRDAASVAVFVPPRRVKCPTCSEAPPTKAETCPGLAPDATGPKCCDRAGEHNGFGTDAPRTFTCPASCCCHD